MWETNFPKSYWNFKILFFFGPNFFSTILALNVTGKYSKHRDEVFNKAMLNLLSFSNTHPKFPTYSKNNYFMFK